MRKVSLALTGVGILVAVCVAALVTFLVWVVFYHASSGRPLVISGEERPHVITTAYPVEFLVKRIGGSDIASSLLIPAGTEPHDFEPTLQDQIALRDAELLVTMGGGFDVWADEAITDREYKRTIIAFDRLSVERTIAGDPHFWLDPTLYAELVDPVTEELSTLDPEHAADFQSRAQALKDQFAALDGEYIGGLISCEKREIVTLHEAFAYLGARYTITIHAVTGLSPEEEPSLEKLAELTDLVRERNISVIFTEPFVDDSFIETIATETGANVETLNPVESLSERGSSSGTEDYFSNMRSNLLKLQDAMLCR